MKNWLLLIGVVLAVYGGFRLISGVWGPDAIVSAGPDNALFSGLAIGLGVVVIIASRFVKEKK